MWRALVTACAIAVALIPVRVSSAAADPWAKLRRPLHIPRLEPRIRCPVSPLARDERDALGSGPVHAFGLGRARVLTFTYPVQPSQRDWFPSEWSGNKVLWRIAPRYRGRVLIRGRQLNGPYLVRFDNGSFPRAELRLSQGGVPSTNGFRDRPSYTRVRAPGCYAWQVDGDTFSQVIVFRAVVARR